MTDEDPRGRNVSLKSVFATYVNAQESIRSAQRRSMSLYHITSKFRDYQRNAINAALNGKDTLIIQQTGSGKSLCYQFPPVYTHTKAIVICPTISLMQDQHAILTARGIQCTYLASAQVDKTLETSVFQSQDPHRIIFVTP